MTAPFAIPAENRTVISREFHRLFLPLFTPYRYKVMHGGRGGMKSWHVARALVRIALERKVLILCARELQASIKDSVHRLLQSQIVEMGLLSWFDITASTIRARGTGSEFIFKGLKHNAAEIKSMEGVDICWVEEAQLVTNESWMLLIPTIRKPGSEIWVTFNPGEEEDATYQRFLVHTPPNTWVLRVGWQDNVWFPAELEMERQHMLRTDPDAYEHVWEGRTRKISQAVIFKGRYVADVFEPPEDVYFRRGVDHGFAVDPAVMTSLYTTGAFPNEELWIHEEAYGWGVEIDELEQLFDATTRTTEQQSRMGKLGGITDAKKWPIKADNSRPETISYLARRGFPITAADKWKGSVEDGITHLKSFKMIHIHATNCPFHLREARLYSWKIDKKKKDQWEAMYGVGSKEQVPNYILPVPEDLNNHGWDSDRYALDEFIKRRGVAAQWARLGEGYDSMM